MFPNQLSPFSFFLAGMLRGAHTPPLFLLSSPLSPVCFTTFISLYTPFSFFMAVGESNSFVLKRSAHELPSLVLYIMFLHLLYLAVSRTGQ